MRTNLLALLLATLPAAALANGYSVPNVNPRDLGMSGSVVAAQRDAAAVFAMPAALPRLDEGLQLAAAASLLDIHADWNAPAGPADASSNLHFAPPAAAFAAYGLTLGGHRAGFGAGFATPFGGNIFWDESWEGRFRVTTVQRRIYGMYLNGAVQSGPHLRFGGGVIYYRGTEYLKQGLDLAVREGTLEASASGGAFSFQAAVEVQPTDEIRLAVGYKHKATMDLEGDAAFHGVPDELRASLPDQRLTHTLTVPNVVDVGAAWQARKDLLVTFTYSFDRYVVYREDRFVGSAGATVDVPRDYGNGHTLRAGAEYRLSRALEVRAGVLRDLSGMKESTFDPSLPDASSWAGSVGASWHFLPNMTADAAFFLAIMDRVRATGGLPGNYDIRAEIFSLGLTWRPGLRF
jgi:long-chain fatty acid transport protein